MNSVLKPNRVTVQVSARLAPESVRFAVAGSSLGAVELGCGLLFGVFTFFAVSAAFDHGRWVPLIAGLAALNRLWRIPFPRKVIAVMEDRVVIFATSRVSNALADVMGVYRLDEVVRTGSVLKVGGKRYQFMRRQLESIVATVASSRERSERISLLPAI
jgi:hypothetical protein